MIRIIKALDYFIETIGRWVSWLSLVLVGLVVVDVVLRYVFNWSSSANQEMEWHLFAVLFLLGAAYTLQHDKHVRVDVFYARFSETNKAWVDLIGTLIFLIPFCVVIIYSSIPFVTDAMQIGESSPEPGGLPYRFVIKSAIPVGAFLLLVQACSFGLASLSTILKINK